MRAGAGDREGPWPPSFVPGGVEGRTRGGQSPGIFRFLRHPPSQPRPGKCLRCSSQGMDRGPTGKRLPCSIHRMIGPRCRGDHPVSSRGGPGLQTRGTPMSRDAITMRASRNPAQGGCGKMGIAEAVQCAFLSSWSAEAALGRAFARPSTKEGPRVFALVVMPAKPVPAQAGSGDPAHSPRSGLRRSLR